MTAPANFRQSDVTRLIKGARKAGCPVEAIKLTVLPDGSLFLSVSSPADNDDLPGDGWEDA